MMYKCLKCNHVFDIPDNEQEKVGEFWGAPAFESHYYCPNCHNESFDEIYEEAPESLSRYEDPIEYQKGWEMILKTLIEGE